MRSIFPAITLALLVHGQHRLRLSGDFSNAKPFYSSSDYRETFIALGFAGRIKWMAEASAPLALPGSIFVWSQLELRGQMAKEKLHERP
jgi:hypothetical protein